MGTDLGRRNLPDGGGEVIPNAGAGEPPTGLGNDQEGGGDGEGIWEPRERGRERREVGGGRVLIGGRQSTCSLSF